jgi:hypothetical protein
MTEISVRTRSMGATFRRRRDPLKPADDENLMVFSDKPINFEVDDKTHVRLKEDEKAGAIVISAPVEEIPPVGSSPQSIEGMTKAQLASALDEKGIQYDAKANKAELQGLLNEALEKESKEGKS